jgi:outer membrane protein
VKILLFISFLPLLVIARPRPVLAESASIVVVDVQRAINESIRGKAARKNVEAEVKKGEVRLKELNDELASLSKELETQSSLLSGQAKNERELNLKKKQRELSLAVQERQDAIAQKNEKEIGDVVAEVDSVVKKIAKEQNIQFIFENDPSFVVFHQPRIDITDTVIEQMNENG